MKTKVHKRLASKAAGAMSGKQRWEAEKARRGREKELEQESEVKEAAESVAQSKEALAETETSTPSKGGGADI